MALVSINFSSSRDLGVSLPLSPRLYPLLQAPPVQDNTVPSHTILLDVRLRGRNQDKPVRYCVASCINIWDEETRSITSWDPDRRIRTPTLSLVAMTSKPFIAQSAPIPNGYTMSTSQQRFGQLEPGKATILAWNCSVTVRLKSRSRRIGTVSAEFLK